MAIVVADWEGCKIVPSTFIRHRAMFYLKPQKIERALGSLVPIEIG